MNEADGCSVLVVDDDEINRILISKLLENQGYRVRTAADGAEALQALKDESFDALLLDVVMPNVNGIEVLQTVKRSSRLWDIPVIMISSVEETKSIVQCLELGAADFLSKPFDPVILRAKISGCLVRKRAHDLEREYQKTQREHAAYIEELNQELSRRVRDERAKTERWAQLRRCLPTRLAEQSLSCGEELESAPRQRLVAVVHLALSDLSTAVEAAGSKAAFAMFEELYRAVDALAADFDATIASSTPEAVTLLLNDLRPWPEPGTQAARLGKALAEAVTRLTADWRTRHGVRVGSGVGVAVGQAALGLVEHRGRADYWAVGPVVDRAGALARTATGTVIVDAG